MTVQDLVDYIRDNHVPLDAVLDSVNLLLYEPNRMGVDMVYDANENKIVIKTDVPYLSIYQIDIEAVVQELPDMETEDEYFDAVMKRVSVDTTSKYWKNRIEKTIRRQILYRMTDAT